MRVAATSDARRSLNNSFASGQRVRDLNERRPASASATSSSNRLLYSPLKRGIKNGAARPVINANDKNTRPLSAVITTAYTTASNGRRARTPCLAGVSAFDEPQNDKADMARKERIRTVRRKQKETEDRLRALRAFCGHVYIYIYMHV